MKIFRIAPVTGRLLFLSDCHDRDFEGVGGYTSAERMEFMLRALLDQRSRGYDGLIFCGDTVTANRHLLTLSSEEMADDSKRTEPIRRFKEQIIDPLEAEGIPCFFINASHDSLTAGDFASVFGYGPHFAVLHGHIAYLCADTFGGERTATMETGEADLSPDVLAGFEEILADPAITAAFVVCHYPNNGENLAALLAHPKLKAVIAGHSHDSAVVSFGGRPLLQTGHFCRAYTKLLSRGNGFKPFVPLDRPDGQIPDERTGTPVDNYSATGSPWQFRAVEARGGLIESYLIFPRMEYRAFSSDGIDFAPFIQPYTEARPAFLGPASPIDRSYWTANASAAAADAAADAASERNPNRQ